MACKNEICKCKQDKNTSLRRIDIPYDYLVNIIKPKIEELYGDNREIHIEWIEKDNIGRFITLGIR